MPKEGRRGRRKPPSYLQHRPSGRAYCWLYDQEGRRRMAYLGPYGSAESHRRFAELREWDELADADAVGGAERDRVEVQGLTVENLWQRFVSWAGREYVRDGERTGEVRNIVDANRQLLRLFGDEQARCFGPKKLKQVRDEMIRDGLARTNINQRVHRIRRMFRWAVEEELLPHGVWDALRSVQPLRYGRSAAREAQMVEPCSDADVAAVLRHVGNTLSTMIQIQSLTGCRPHEVCELKASDIDVTGKRGCWIWAPQRHKTQHRGRARRIAIGPKAQALLGPFLRVDGGYLFSPTESERERSKARRAARRTPVQPSQQRRNAERAVRRKDRVGDHYDVHAYRRAIHRACRKAGIEKWSPHQLRHRRCVEVEREKGPEAARSVLGHSSIAVTAHYAHLDEERAIDVMRELG